MSYNLEAAVTVMYRDYMLLAFMVSLGTLQTATTISGARGLWLLPWKLPTRLLGMTLIAVGILIFIISPIWIQGPWAAGSVIHGTSEGREWGTATMSEVVNARTLNDIHGGLDGNDYARLFPLSALLAFIASALAGTINMKFTTSSHTQKDSSTINAEGLDALAFYDYPRALAISLRKLRPTIKTDFQQLMSQAPKWSLPKIIEKGWRR